jgi:starch phosphorylase
MNGLLMDKCEWIKGEFVKAMAYDTPVPGYNTFNTNCLRLWSALPSFEKNYKYHCQNDDDYINLIETRQRAERITSVLYPKEDRNSDDI